LCLTRNPEPIKHILGENIRLVKADISNHEELSRVMSKQIDIAYYLVHSMEGASTERKKFSERNRVAAKTFAQVARECGVKRIIYLGRLVDAEADDDGKLSEHMRSRREVGEILQQHFRNCNGCYCDFLPSVPQITRESYYQWSQTIQFIWSMTHY
jgi:NAD(P)H-binding